MLKYLADQLYYPFETPVTPHADEIELSTRQWVQDFNMLSDAATFQRFCRINYGWLGARFFPYATSDATAIGSHWIAWLFTLDDEFDEQSVGSSPKVLAQAFQKFIDILNGAEGTQTPLSRSLIDLRERTRALSPDESWFPRFVISVQQYFDACTWEARNRIKGHPPDLESYIRLRQHAGAQTIVVALIEMMENMILPDHVRNHPRIKALTDMTLNLMGWGNDILSVDKELHAGDVHNLVLVLEHEYALSREDAYTWAIEVHNQEMRRFLLFERNLPTFGTDAEGHDLDANVQRYLLGLRALIRGSVDWTIIDAPVRYAELKPLLDRAATADQSLVVTEAA
ncbi:terpene synthase family protein [Alkalinema pantanalense CENA528]|uniref:terpene synthase family protein n=1 Tax=Alkalinema pantanalense TaxID=1620705 RepID=UPI003D6DE39B